MSDKELLKTIKNDIKNIDNYKKYLNTLSDTGFYVSKNNNKTPTHYKGSIQPIDLINAQDLNFNLGNVVKYVCRAGKKQGENILSDLEKAKDYINYEIERVKQWTKDNAKN